MYLSIFGNSFSLSLSEVSSSVVEVFSDAMYGMIASKPVIIPFQLAFNFQHIKEMPLP